MATHNLEMVCLQEPEELQAGDDPKTQRCYRFSVSFFYSNNDRMQNLHVAITRIARKKNFVQSTFLSINANSKLSTIPYVTYYWYQKMNLESASLSAQHSDQQNFPTQNSMTTLAVQNLLLTTSSTKSWLNQTSFLIFYLRQRMFLIGRLVTVSTLPQFSVPCYLELVMMHM